MFWEEKEKRCACVRVCVCVGVCVCASRILQVEGRKKISSEAAGKSSDVAQAPRKSLHGGTALQQRRQSES